MAMLQALALFLLAAGAAAQEFPFKNGPLDPSLHSNKIFFNITDPSDIQGVWKGIVDIRVPDFSVILAEGVTIDDVCGLVLSQGLDYSHLERLPLTSIVFPGENEGEILKIMDMRVNTLANWTAVSYDEDGVMRMADDSCLIWRPYFDWEVGKTMFLRNRRAYVWFDDGQIMTHTTQLRQFCVPGEVDHPFCSRQTFLIDGQEKDGVVVDTIMMFECTAGPCLELPHSLPGYVKTQGWQPRN